MRAYAAVPGTALICACCMTAPAFAEDAPVSETKVAPSAFNQEEPKPVPGWGVGEARSYWVPLADITAFIVALNIVDRTVIGGHDYDANPSTWERNFKGHWVYDNDPFDINQFMHPYQGNMYFGFSRSAGLNFWESYAYSNVGSYIWEVAGEATPPSINDQITTGTGGAFLGEALFRLASLALETRDGPIGRLRELVVAAISPGTGFNRWAYGDRFDSVFRSADPAVYTRGQLGVNINSSVKSDINLSEIEGGDPEPQSYKEGEAAIDFTVAYGMPGKPGYHYTRPFDHFNMQVTASSASYLENLMVRGLLTGTDFAWGDDHRGLWGLYGTYDYISPQIFRISTTGLGLGTANQWWLGRTTALQADVVGGLGYGSGGIFDGPGERNYHRGATGQALLSSRLLFNDRFALDLAARAYRINDTTSTEEGSEEIYRGEAGFTIRLVGLHGISVRYTASRRDANYRSQPKTRQDVGAVSIAYAYLGHKWLGAVDWRPEAQTVK